MPLSDRSTLHLPLSRWRRRVAAPLAALGLSLGTASAAQCTLQLSDVSLGIYNPQSALDTLAPGSVSVSCVKTLGDLLGLSLNLFYSLSLSGAVNATTPRVLNGPAGSGLNYFVSTLPPGGTGGIWGNGAGGTEQMTGQALLPAILSIISAQPVVQTLPYVVRAPAGQNVRAGNYSAPLVVTLSF